MNTQLFLLPQCISHREHSSNQNVTLVPLNRENIVHLELSKSFLLMCCCIRCGPDEECILDIVPREDGAHSSG